jgi:hypothetical protein
MTEPEPPRDPEQPGEVAHETAESPERALRHVYGSLRLRIFLALTLAIFAVVGSGILILVGPREVLLLAVPALLLVEFGCGFFLSGRLMALALARHHDRLRTELVQQQEDTKKVLVTRWLSLEPGEREKLREKFPDVDWNAIDGLAGTAAEAQTKH